MRQRSTIRAPIESTPSDTRIIHRGIQAHNNGREPLEEITQNLCRLSVVNVLRTRLAGAIVSVAICHRGQRLRHCGQRLGHWHRGIGVPTMIRDHPRPLEPGIVLKACLLYTSDAADDL